MGDAPDPTVVFFGAVNAYIGSVAVAVFFITSGFLLAMSADKGSSIRAFCAHRILRIYPGLVVCNLIVVATCWAIFNHFDSSFIWQHQTFSYLALNSLMLFNSADAFAANDWLPASFTNVRLGFADGSLWTLAAEIKVYVLMVAAMLALRVALPNSWKRWQPAAWAALLGVSIFGFRYIPFAGGEPRFHDLFVFFFAGAAVYTFRGHIPLSGIAAVFFLAALWIVKDAAPGAYEDLSFVAYPYIVLYAAYGVPYAPALNTFGDFSYGVYVYGWFIQNLVASLSRMMITPLQNFAIAAVLSLAAGALSWRFIEKPAMSLKTQRPQTAPPPASEIDQPLGAT